MTCDETKLLLSEYWSQSLGEAEELAFEAHIATCDPCRGEAERLGEMWKSLALIPGLTKDFDPSANLRSRFYETLGAYRHGLESAPKRTMRDRILALWPKQPQWQMATSFALLLIGLLAGYELRPGGQVPFANHDGGQGTELSQSQISQLRGEVSSMRQMVALSLMQQQSAGERLRGVSYAYQAPSSDMQVLSALLTTVNQDESVGVRIAAVEALHTFGASPVTRDAVVQSIRKQTAPLVQIKLIDLLVDFKDKGAMPELAALSKDATVDASVRERASQAMEGLQ